MFKQTIIKLASSYSALVIFLSFVLVSLFFQRDFLIYRDFSIIWNGALLVAEGYKPWADFIMPISPLSIYLLGLFLSLTEKTWLAIQIFQIIMNCILLALVANFLIKFERKKIPIIISLSIFTFFYLSLLTHPWYNNFGAFFLLVSIFLANYQLKIFIFLNHVRPSKSPGKQLSLDSRILNRILFDTCVMLLLTYSSVSNYFLANF